jgi:polar amino acid transport system substrate-binding protein
MDIELFYNLAEELGVKLAFYPVQRTNFLAQLNQGEIDIVPGVYYETFNLIKMELTNPYIEGHIGLVVKDYNRQLYTDPQAVQKRQPLRLALLGKPLVIKRMKKTLQLLVPDTQLHIFPIKTYDEFFAMNDEQVDGLIESIEVGSALTLLHPEYTTIVPKKSVLKFPMSFAIARGEKDFLVFMTQWIKAKKYSGLIHDANKYWVEGKGSEQHKARWSIMHDVLGW